MRYTLLLFMLLPLFQALLILEDKLNALSLGIDLQSCIECLTTLGSHAFHLHGFAFHKIFVLDIRERYAFDFLGDVYTVGAQGDNLIGLRIDRYVGRERFGVLGCYLNGLAQITRNEQLLLFFGRELVGKATLI